MIRRLTILLLIVGCATDSTIPKDCAGVADGSAFEDCAGICGGTAAVDECGVCDSDTTNDCADCADTFSFNSSMSQAFYYCTSVTIDGVLVDSDDWVGAFKGNVCIGARKWDTSQCGGGVCDLPAMGDDGMEGTAGYMTIGDIPSFKIYDASKNKLFNAVASEDIPWANLGFGSITLSAITDSFSNCP